MSDDVQSLFNRVKQLEVHTPQGHSGSLIRESSFVFNYGRADLQPDLAVALSMPVRAKSYSSGTLMGVFAMNRPEGYLRYIIEDRLKRLGAPSDMFLLYLAGSNQIGRLTYVMPGHDHPQSNGEKLSDLLKEPSGALFKRLVDQYALGSGISGVQPKALVPLQEDLSGGRPVQKATLPLKSVIAKAEGSEYFGLARNEYFCMSVAKKAGLDVPEFWLSEDGRMFYMSRFDRTPEGVALGFEDMAVLTGRHAGQKYEGSYEMVGMAVKDYTGQGSNKQLEVLFDRVAISCMLGDADAHLKNFGMLYEHPGAERRLAPVYDVVCTLIYPELDRTLALKMDNKKNFPDVKRLADYGSRLGLAQAKVKEKLERINDALYDVAKELSVDERYKRDGLLQDMMQSISHLQNPEHQNVVSVGNRASAIEYEGIILDIQDDVVIQKTGRHGQTARHNRSLLQGEYKVGQNVSIAYGRDGNATVMPHKEKTNGIAD